MNKPENIVASEDAIMDLGWDGISPSLRNKLEWELYLFSQGSEGTGQHHMKDAYSQCDMHDIISTHRIK